MAYGANAIEYDQDDLILELFQGEKWPFSGDAFLVVAVFIAEAPWWLYYDYLIKKILSIFYRGALFLSDTLKLEETKETIQGGVALKLICFSSEPNGKLYKCAHPFLASYSI